jgi:hypothetical protein
MLLLTELFISKTRNYKYAAPTALGFVSASDLPPERNYFKP